MKKKNKKMFSVFFHSFIICFFCPINSNRQQQQQQIPESSLFTSSVDSYWYFSFSFSSFFGTKKKIPLKQWVWVELRNLFFFQKNFPIKPQMYVLLNQKKENLSFIKMRWVFEKSIHSLCNQILIIKFEFEIL